MTSNTKTIQSFKSVEEVYKGSMTDGQVTTQVERYTAIRDKFKQLYGCDPQFFARAPGRIDIMGGHIDYNLNSLCSAAIDRDVILACSKIGEGEEDEDCLVVNDMDDQAK